MGRGEGLLLIECMFCSQTELTAAGVIELESKPGAEQLKALQEVKEGLASVLA